MPKINLLCVGRDELLLETRLRVLSLQYPARGARNIDEMNDMIAEHFDAILFCHSLTTAERNAAAVFAREHWPKARLLEITGPDTHFEAGLFDAEVGALEGPTALLRSVKRLLCSNASGARRRDSALL